MSALAPPRGSLPVLQYCTPDQLAVDPSYQRELDQVSRALITRIAKGWDWNLFQPLVVARRSDGRLFVVDGQHRLEAARQRGDIAQLPAVIFTPEDRTNEAAVFVELNQARRPLTPFALWNGALAAGDATAATLQQLMREAGLTFSGAADAKKMKPGQLNNVGTIRAWHRRNGDRRTRAVLSALSRAFGSEVIRLGGVLFMGVAAIVIEHDERLSEHLLVDVLQRPQDEWAADFRRHAAAAGVGIQAAGIAVLRASYAEALAEVEAEEAA